MSQPLSAREQTTSLKIQQDVMTYTPSESEKQTTAAIQALAAVTLIIAPLIASRSNDYHKSPFVRYWTKTCLVFCAFTTAAMIVCLTILVLTGLAAPAMVIYILHFLFCIIGALSSYFNTPFRYYFIANRYCLDELGDVYGQLLSHEE